MLQKGGELCQPDHTQCHWGRVSKMKQNVSHGKTYMSLWSSIPKPIITIDNSCAGAVHIETTTVRMMDLVGFSIEADASAPTHDVCNTSMKSKNHL